MHIRRIWIIGTRYRLVPSSSASSSSLNQRELPKVLGRISRRSDPALQPRFRQLRCKRAGECELQPNGFQSEPKAAPLSHKEEHDEEAVIDAPPSSKSPRHRGPTSGSCRTHITTPSVVPGSRRWRRQVELGIDLEHRSPGQVDAHQWRQHATTGTSSTDPTRYALTTRMS